MADSFFGFNTSLPGLLDEELHDEPGQILDEEEEEYDALNDETFGTDAVEGDWEQDHEKLSEITEQSRARSNSGGGRLAAELERDAGLELEANLAQLVLEDYDDDVVLENGGSGGGAPRLQSQVPAGEGRAAVEMAAPGPARWALPGKTVVSVAELERGLLPQRPPPPPGLGSVLRLEDVERDLTSVAVGPRTQHPDLVVLRNSQNAAAVAAAALGRGASPFTGPVLALGPRGQMVLPGGRLLAPPGPPHTHPGLQNHGLMGSGSAPRLLRFLPPPHLLPGGPPPGKGPLPPHPGGFPGSGSDNGLLRSLQGRPLGLFHPGLAQQQRAPGSAFGPRMDRAPHLQPFFSNNRSYQQQPQLARPYPQQQHGARHEYDEYAGLMTAREKHWLLNIQNLQLNTDRPHIDDYYYTVFQSRRPKTEQEREHERRQEVQRERRDSARERDGRPEAQPRVYTPAQFENSLGKLQIGSVTAPRKIIDMDVVSPEGLDVLPVTNQRDTRRAKQVLLEIERLYLLLLQLEDLSSPLAQLQQSVPEDRPALVQRILSSLLAEDRLVAALCVRKGKALLLRLLPHVPAADNGPPQLLALWVRLLRALPALGRRDQGTDQALLPRLHPHFHRWVAALPFAALLQLARALLPAPPSQPPASSTPTPTARTASPVGRGALVYALGNKFGVSVLASLLARAEELFPGLDAAQQQDWKAFLAGLLEAAGAHCTASTELPSPLQPLDAAAVSRHLARCDCVAPRIERLALLERLLAAEPVPSMPAPTPALLAA